MKIFNIEEASKTILKRKALHRMEYSPLIIQRTEEFFGVGITPPMAVEIILNSVEDDGDLAIRKWSDKLDSYRGNEICHSYIRFKNAWEQQDSVFNKQSKPPPSGSAFHEMQPIKAGYPRDGGTAGAASHSN